MSKIDRFPPEINRNRVSERRICGFPDVDNPTVKPLHSALDAWRRQLIHTVAEMRAAGIDRELIASEIDATARALRWTAGLDA